MRYRKLKNLSHYSQMEKHLNIIRKLIIDGKFKEAIEKCKEIELDAEDVHTLSLHEAQYERYENNKRKGLVEREQLEAIINNLDDAMFYFVRNLKENQDNLSFKKSTPPSASVRSNKTKIPTKHLSINSNLIEMADFNLLVSEFINNSEKNINIDEILGEEAFISLYNEDPTNFFIAIQEGIQNEISHCALFNAFNKTLWQILDEEDRNTPQHILGSILLTSGCIDYSNKIHSSTSKNKFISLMETFVNDFLSQSFVNDFLSQSKISFKDIKDILFGNVLSMDLDAVNYKTFFLGKIGKLKEKIVSFFRILNIKFSTISDKKLVKKIEKINFDTFFEKNEKGKRVSVFDFDNGSLGDKEREILKKFSTLVSNLKKVQGTEIRNIRKEQDSLIQDYVFLSKEHLQRKHFDYFKMGMILGLSQIWLSAPNSQFCQNNRWIF